MEIATKIAWFLLAAVHVSPAAILFRPGLMKPLYGISPEGPAGLLLTHRGAVFLAVAAASVWAAFDPPARRLAAMVTGVSIVGFLFLYVAAGLPPGPLGRIALIDALALAPLLFVLWRAWRA